MMFMKNVRSVLLAALHMKSFPIILLNGRTTGKNKFHDCVSFDDIGPSQKKNISVSKPKMINCFILFALTTAMSAHFIWIQPYSTLYIVRN